MPAPTRTLRITTWAATLTHVHGNHTFRYGGEYLGAAASPTKGCGNSGRVRFQQQLHAAEQRQLGGTGVGSTFATFLLDMPSGGNIPRNADAFYTQLYTAGYFPG